RSGRLCGVVNFWPVNEIITEATTPAEWNTIQIRIAASVFHATQAVLSIDVPAGTLPARIWLVTRGAQSVAGPGAAATKEIQPLQGIVWGVARVVSLEHPNRFGAVIDLD